MRLERTRTVQFWGSIFSVSLQKEGNEEVRNLHEVPSLYLLVEVADVNVAFFIGDLDVTEVFLKLNVDHFSGYGTPELVRVDVNFDFGFLIAPAEFVNVIGLDLGHGLLDSGCTVNVRLRVSLNQNRVTTVDFAIFLKVNCTLGREICTCVRVIVLKINEPSKGQRHGKFWKNFTSEKFATRDTHAAFIRTDSPSRFAESNYQYLQNSVPSSGCYLGEHWQLLHSSFPLPDFCLCSSSPQLTQPFFLSFLIYKIENKIDDLHSLVGFWGFGVLG